MSDEDRVTVRATEGADAERIREIVHSSMTADYALSPEEIETVVDTEFAPEAQRERFDGDDATALVAELPAVDGDGTTIAGVVEATGEEDGGTVRWLHVDPERRGEGVGSALFERVRSELTGRGAGETRAAALAANTSSGAFFERFDFGKVDERDVEIGGLDLVEYVFTEGGDGSDDDASGPEVTESAAGGLDEEVGSDGDDGDDADTLDAPDTVTADGEEVYPGDDPFEGTEGRFVPTYRDPDRTEEFGYYCLNCESTDVSMDSMERIRCGNCGNTRKPDDDYDGSYL